jgi:hypothetical protein
MFWQIGFTVESSRPWCVAYLRIFAFQCSNGMKSEAGIVFSTAREGFEMSL